MMRIELQYLAMGSAGLATECGVGELQVSHDDFQVAGQGDWVMMGSYPLRESRSWSSMEKVMDGSVRGEFELLVAQNKQILKNYSLIT